MDVGFYFELENPPDSERSMDHVYGFALEMCEEADRLGAGSVWFSEHHLFPTGFLPQPLVFCAAVAARTKSIRLGTAVTIAPLRSAVHLAEEAVVVDLISGGRFDLGLGTGYRVPEFELFGVNADGRYSQTDSRAREVRRLLHERMITPTGTQARLPIWMGYMGPQGARRAGRLGEGLLNADARHWPEYRTGLREGGHDERCARMAGGILGWVTEDPERDWPVVSANLRSKYNLYRKLAIEGTGRPDPRPVDPDRLRGKPLGGLMQYFLHATPEEAARRIGEFTAGAPVEAVHLVAPIAGMDEAMVVNHIHTVCTKLAPALAKLDPVRSAPSQAALSQP